MSFWLDLQANVKFNLVQFLLCMQTTADLWFLFYLSQLIALSAQTDTCLRNRGPQLAKWGRFLELPHWLNFHPWKLLLGIKFVSAPVTKQTNKQTPKPHRFHLEVYSLLSSSNNCFYKRYFTWEQIGQDEEICVWSLDWKSSLYQNKQTNKHNISIYIT